MSKGVAPGIVRAATQYGVESELLGCATFDVTRNPWRRGGWMDAIITDPPCEFGFTAIQISTMSRSVQTILARHGLSMIGIR